MRLRTPATLFGLFVMFALVLATAVPGEADRRGGGYRGGSHHRGHHGGWHRGGGRHHHHHHHHHHRRWYGGRWKSGVFIGAPFLFAAPLAYRYPAYAPPVVVEPPPAPVYVEPDPPPYWYYCQSAGAYYPNVGSCPEGWLQVAPQPNPSP